MSEKLILASDAIARIIDEYSQKIYDEIKGGEYAIIGVQTRGVELAKRIKKRIKEISGKEPRSGILDITFFRDDLSTRGYLPVIKETRIDFDINGMNVILVDDVIFTGRTTKAAIETLMGFGRPKSIRLFVLVDRGNRELPIQPDYCGFTISTGINDEIKVRLKETDSLDDSVILIKK
jgi:pyrimidine operon attenuation protein/uracil phosphoribosyltransferase